MARMMLHIKKDGDYQIVHGPGPEEGNPWLLISLDCLDQLLMSLDKAQIPFLN